VGIYGELGERLIERGYGALPIMPGTKRPGFLFAGCWIGLANWQRRFNNGIPSSMERARWAAGDSGLCVVAGHNGLVAIDTDTTTPSSRRRWRRRCRRRLYVSAARRARPRSITASR
jgi:hypothetical protein